MHWSNVQSSSKHSLPQVIGVPFLKLNKYNKLLDMDIRGAKGCSGGGVSMPNGELAVVLNAKLCRGYGVLWYTSCRY